MGDRAGVPAGRLTRRRSARRLLSASGLSRDHLRIAFTQPPDQLREAAAALATAWAAVSG